MFLNQSKAEDLHRTCTKLTEERNKLEEVYF